MSDRTWNKIFLAVSLALGLPVVALAVYALNQFPAK
jgi:hypothetical protein